MGLFSRKQKVRLDEFCREFYNTHLLNPDLAGINPALLYCNSIKRTIAEVESRFSQVEVEPLMKEILIIRFETFGLAWLHRQGNKRVAEQSEFTRRYLEEAGRSDIWEDMQGYNDASARSSKLGKTNETGAGRAYLTFVNGMRADLADEWFKLGFDPVSVGRAANRLFTEVAWKNGLTPGFLMCTLCARLGFEENLNEEAEFRMVAIIRGFYDGVAQSMKAVSIKG